MRDRIMLVVFAMLLPILVGWMNPLRDVTQKGLEHYGKGEYEPAIQAYIDAELRAPEDPRLAYNRGAVNYKMDKYDAALAEFEKALTTTDPKFRSRVRYNMGNVKFKQEDYPGAIEHYVESLKLDPANQDAKFNLELARRRLKEQLDKNKEQQEEQQQQKQDQEQQDQEKSEQQQQQQQQGQEEKKDEEQQREEEKKGEQEEKQEQQQAQAGEEKKDEKPSQQAQSKPMKAEELSPEEAERMLRNLARDEMERRRDLQRKRSTQVGNPEKDW